MVDLEQSGAPQLEVFFLNINYIVGCYRYHKPEFIEVICTNLAI